MVQIREFSKSKVVIDDRYLPLIISTFTGNADAETARWHIETQNRIIVDAARQGKRIVSINDSTASGRPDAEARKFWADSMSNASATIRSATIKNLVVVDSALIRGALTAIGWLNPKAAELASYATMKDAIDAALVLLDQNGQQRPAVDSAAYELPKAAS